MDIDSIVKSLMTAKRVPLDKLNQQKTLLQWTRDSYRELNSKIVNFRNNKLQKFNLSAEMNTQKAVLSGNTTAIKAEPSASANAVPMTVEVTELAEKSSIRTNSPLMTAPILNDDGTEVAPARKATMNTTLGELAGWDDSTDDPDGKTIKLFINNATMVFNKSDSLSTVINKINSDTTANVKAAYDELSGEFTITAREYGSNYNVKYTDKEKTEHTTSPFLTLMGSVTRKDATQGKMTIKNRSGGEETFTTDNNTVTINGVKITALELTKLGEPSEIRFETDPQKTVDTIKAFVEEYNSLLNFLNTKVGEEKYRKFPPLTDEQRKELSEDDIKKWEEKAKSGLHKNDELLVSTISSMRFIITEYLGDLSNYGITTGKYFENGKLILDEEKLKQAVSENPQRIADLFQGPANAPNTGIFDKLSDEMNKTLDKLVEKAGTSKYSTDLNSLFKPDSIMGKQLRDFDKRIDDMNARLIRYENNYYRQFTAMEAAMSKYESQSSSLANYFK